MIKADKYLKETIKDILENGQWDKNPRTRWSDNSVAHSKFVTQKVYQYDISKGEYPINTLRTTALKGALGEVLTIYRDQSNKQEDFIRNGVNWWGDWINEEGNLGTAYAWNLEPYYDNNKVVKVERRAKHVTKLDVNFNFKNVYTEPKNKLSNKVVKGKFCTFRILDKTSNNPVRYNVQLLDSGEVREVGYTQIRNKNIKSNFYKSVYGVGFYGNYSKFEWLGDKTINSLKKKWTQMFERCFSKNVKFKDWTPEMIDDRWSNFEYFVEDCINIPQFFSAKRDNFKGWVLDKDYYGANFYSKNTCVFIKYKDNALYSEKNSIYTFEDEVFLSQGDLAKKLNMNGDMVCYILSKSNLIDKNKKIKDSIKVVKNNHEKYLYRFKLYSNQLNNLLLNLENNPYSRRHMISLFNWEHQHSKQLVECAFETLWSVRDVDNGYYKSSTYDQPDKWVEKIIRYIDLTLIQRSQDLLVVSSINPAQYIMLGMMVCNHLTFKTGIKHELGNLLHIVQNCHIYDRHLEAAKELLQRKSTGLQPKIELICEPKDFYSHAVDDFKFSNLEGIKPLTEKLEIAI